MSRWLPFCGLALVLAAAAGSKAEAAATAWVGDARAAVRLITGSDSVGSSATLAAGIEFRYEPGWHGYWRTPGDTGIAPIFDWAGSQNLKAAAVAWLAPTRLVVSGLQNGILTGQFVLPVTIGLSDPQNAAQLTLSVDYAACANICVPEHADLSLRLAHGDGGPSEEEAGLRAAQAAVPGPASPSTILATHVRVTPVSAGMTLTVDLRSAGRPFHHPDLFVEGAGDGLPPVSTVMLADGGWAATLTASLPAPVQSDHPLTLTVVDDDRAIEFAGPIIGSRPADAERGLTAILAIALLGGLILNLMPCVLPILSIKLFGLARHAGAGRRATRLGFTATALGIMTSFLALATALIGLKATGATLGWGIQFQQPWFLVALALTTVLFAASMFEWLPIGLPRAFARFGGRTGRGGLAEAFLTGAFSTLLATPCSAPFVGTAVGFALARGPGEIGAVFASLGLGMALPFLLAAAFPGLVAWLPRPGPWMVGLRQVLGLMLLGTAIWLLIVLWNVAGFRLTATVAGLLLALLTLRAWVAHRHGFDARLWTRLATVSLAGLAILAAFAIPQSSAGRSAPTDAWQVFDPDVIDRLVVSGKTVLVDVTATWCLTCKVNDITTFEASRIRARLLAPNTVRMRADWSRPDTKIAAYLQRFARYGIPLDVVYGPGQTAGEVLPELLTPAVLLDALDRAGHNLSPARTAAP